MSVLVDPASRYVLTLQAVISATVIVDMCQLGMHAMVSVALYTNT